MVNTERTSLASTATTATTTAARATGAAVALLTLVAALVAAPGAALAQSPVPEITRAVTDLAGVLAPADEAALAERLVAHRAATGVQIAVLTVQTTAGEPIEDFSHRVATRWRGGQAGRDNGALVTLAVRDRRSRIDLGYGLEAAVPDAEARRMLDGMRPRLRAGDYAGALTEVTARLVERTGGATPDPGATTPDPAERSAAAAQSAWQRAYDDALRRERLEAQQRAELARTPQRGTLGAMECFLGFAAAVALAAWALVRAGRRRADLAASGGSDAAGVDSHRGYRRDGDPMIHAAALGYHAGSQPGEHQAAHDHAASASWSPSPDHSPSNSWWGSGGGSSSTDFSSSSGGSDYSSSSSSSSSSSDFGGGGGDFGGGGSSSGW